MPGNSLEQDQDQSIAFCAMDIPESLKLGIQELGYMSPTAFQKSIFEHFKNGQNVACLGQSNYGKSLAYNLPILSKINATLLDLQALIICDSPAQADIALKECRLLSRHLGININTSLDQTYNTQVLICSADNVESSLDSILKEQSLGTIFFDNLGELNARHIINILSSALSDKEIQILIFGNETINAIKDQAQEVLDSVAFVNNSDQPKIVLATKHKAYVINEKEPKPRALLAVLELYQPQKALITCNEANECDLLARFLSRYGFRTLVCSEENNAQGLASGILELSRNNADVLICQNNILDNISLEKVSFMINYDMIERPQLYEQATQFNKQASGIERLIVNLLSNRELGFIGPIKAQCLIEISLGELPSSDEVLALSTKRLVSELCAEASLVELGQFETLAQEMLKDPQTSTILALLLRNHFLKAPISAPAPRRSERPERRERPHRERERPESKSVEKQDDHETKTQAQPGTQGSTRLYVTLGRQDGFDDLASLAQFLSERSSIDLGHFSGAGMLRDRSAHIEVDDDVAQKIIDALNNSERPKLGGQSAEASPIVCERARMTTERPHRRPPMRRGGNFQRRR